MAKAATKPAASTARTRDLPPLFIAEWSLHAVVAAPSAEDLAGTVEHLKTHPDLSREPRTAELAIFTLLLHNAQGGRIFNEQAIPRIGRLNPGVITRVLADHSDVVTKIKPAIEAAIKKHSAK